MTDAAAVADEIRQGSPGGNDDGSPGPERQGVRRGAGPLAGPPDPVFREQVAVRIGTPPLERKAPGTPLNEGRAEEGSMVRMAMRLPLKRRRCPSWPSAKLLLTEEARTGGVGGREESGGRKFRRIDRPRTESSVLGRWVGYCLDEIRHAAG